MERPEVVANQGPLNSDLLHLQYEHRSYGVFNGDDWAMGELQCRRGDLKIWNDFVPSLHNNEVVWQILEEMGFDRILRLGFVQLDWSLIQSLVERWRPETHTFHFSFGEATITLQDVELLLGIGVDGDAVTGSDGPPPQGWTSYMQEHLGIENPKFDKSRMFLSSLSDRIKKVPEGDIGDNWHHQTALCLVAYLLGGFFFVDSSQNGVYCHVVRALVEDVEHKLSWGSALLAVLYRNLCRTSLIGGPGSISGCLVLLQIWAWERITCVRPSIQPALTHPAAPLGARWAGPKSKLHVTKHVLQAYRSQLVMLDENEFVFTPYSDVEVSDVPWISSTYLIFFEVCKGHYPDRVERQFGYIQMVPEWDILLDAEDLDDLHRKKRTRGTIDWSHELQNFVANWNNRDQEIYIGEDPIVAGRPTVSAEYLHWFSQRTVKFVGNPSHTRAQLAPEGYIGHADQLRLLIDGISDITQLVHEWARECLQDPLHGPRYRQLEEIGANTLRLANFEHPPIQPTQSMSQLSPSQQRKRPGATQKIGGRGGSRTRGGGGHEVSHDDDEEEGDESQEHENYNFLFTPPPDSASYNSIFAAPFTTGSEGVRSSQSTCLGHGSEGAGPSQSTPKGRGFRQKHIAYKKKRGPEADFTTPKPRRKK